MNAVAQWPLDSPASPLSTRHIPAPLQPHRRADPGRFLGGQGEAQDLAPLLSGQTGRLTREMGINEMG